MSDRDFSNSSSGRPTRDTGEAPLLGKVSRTPISGIATRHGVGKHRRRHTGNRKVVKAWSVLFAVIAFMIVISISVYQIKNQKTVETKQNHIYPLAENLSSSNIEKTRPPTADLGNEKALETVAAALTNRDPVKFNDYFIPPKDGTATEAIERLERLDTEEGPVIKMKWLGSNFANNKLFEEVVVFREKDGKSTNRLAQLLPRPGNIWLIDFDSLLRSTSHDWKKILDGEIPTAEVRVFVAPDNYYNGIFTDERKWQAFALVSPDAPDVFYGYVLKESAQYEALIRIISADGMLHRATLEITSLPETAERQYQISRVLSENWFVSEEAFDKSF